MSSALTRSALLSSKSGAALAPAARPAAARRPKLMAAPFAAVPPRNDSTQSGGSNNPLANPLQRFAEFDFLSAGMGALAVTSYCVWRGQDPLTALSITAAATVTAVVANELMLEAERKEQE